MVKQQRVKELTLEGFRKYGTYVEILNLTDASTEKESGSVNFTPDILQVNLGHSTNASLSITAVRPRENVINFMEYHTNTGEGVLPLDGDVYIHVAPPSPKNRVPMEQVEVFYVPKGTAIELHMGVWHGAPYAVGTDMVNVLCILPERTYANDSSYHMVPEDEQIHIIDELRR